MSKPMITKWTNIKFKKKTLKYTICCDEEQKNRNVSVLDVVTSDSLAYFFLKWNFNT